MCVRVTTRECVSRVLCALGPQGRCPTVYGRIITNGHMELRRRTKASAAERASLGEGEGRGRGGIYISTVQALSESGIWGIVGFAEGERG